MPTIFLGELHDDCGWMILGLPSFKVVTKPIFDFIIVYEEQQLAVRPLFYWRRGGRRRKRLNRSLTGNVILICLSNLSFHFPPAVLLPLLYPTIKFSFCSSTNTMSTKESEFSRRDAMGLKPLLPDAKSEAQTRQKYFKMIGLFNFVVAPSFAMGLIWIANKLMSSKMTYTYRLELLRDYDLGWLYAAWYVLMLTRSYATINANGAREAARVDRPDQHTYKIMANPQSKTGAVDLSNAPYVLMENVGPVGRFNRAQRAAFHFDEGLELLLGSIFLAGIIFPQLVFGLMAIYCVGRKRFTDGYTESCKGRMGPFALVVLPSMIIAALVGIIAVQAIVL
jgi:hypothetical protein